MSDNNTASSIAIIGMACLYPGSRDVGEFWRNILNGVDCVTDPPPSAWDPDVYYAHGSTATDRVSAKRGGYIADLATFDPLPFGVPPHDVGGEPDQWLALRLARDALADAGYLDAPPEIRHRTAVVLGRGLYPNSGSVNAVQHTLIVTQTLQVIKQLQPEMSDAELEEIRTQLKDSLPPFGADTAPALTPNMITGRIANRLDLMGPNYTVDAACASSLLAVKAATRELRSGDCDLALAGGSQIWTSMPILGVFGQMGALSKTEHIRPFDKDADGTLLSEGVAFVVLKRLADAERDDDRIYAVVRGVGIASDGRSNGLMAPRREGQVLAMHKAYADAGVDPQTIGLIEAHGTGTPVGDVVEMQSMREVFGGRRGEVPTVAVGSVKSMIGHAMPAAGAAGLIKTALALHHRVLPPSLHCENPNPKLGLAESPFYLNSETRAWTADSSLPRRAAVSSFGFGGINGHLVLEEYVPTRAVSNSRSWPVQQFLPDWPTELCVLAARSRADLATRAEDLARELEGDVDEPLIAIAHRLAAQIHADETERLAVVATSRADLRAKLERAAQRLRDASRSRIRDGAGIYYASSPLAKQGKVAFLFPGEGSQYPGMMSELVLHFPEARGAFEEANAIRADVGGVAPSHLLHPAPGLTETEKAATAEYSWTMGGAVSGVLSTAEAMVRVLGSLGVEPDAVAGHSSGECAALRAAGVFRELGTTGFTELAQALVRAEEASAADTDIAPVALIALGADREAAEILLAEVDGFVAMDNCPFQTVIAVAAEDRERLLAAARSQAIITEVLRFDRPYHTPWFQRHTDRLQQALAGWKFAPPAVTAYSCATADVVDDTTSIGDLLAAQWSEPVEFRRMVERMYDDGFRIFVEVGAGNHLMSFTEDVLRGRPIVAVATNLEHSSDTTQINHAIGLLFAQGVDVGVTALTSDRVRSTAPRVKSPTEVTLKTGFAAMSLGTFKKGNTMSPPSLNLTASAPPPLAKAATNGASAIGPDSSPVPAASTSYDAPPLQSDVAAVAHRYLETMDHFLSVQENVLLAFLGSPPTGVASPRPAARPRARNGMPAPVVAAALPSPAPVAAPTVEPDVVPATPAPRIEPVAVVSAPPPQPTETGDIDRILREIVSDRTGYPAEVIDLSADLEADLGIDSIKRVEILGTLRKRRPAVQALDMEKLTGCRTLQQIADLALAQGGGSPFELASDVGEGPPSEANSQDHPVLGSWVEFVPGTTAIARLTIDPDHAEWLADHTIGREVSTRDNTLRALPIMPLTLSLELMAQAAAALQPGRVVTRFDNVAARRWIEFGDGSRTVEIRAQVTDSAQGRIDCAIAVLDGTVASTAVEAAVTMAPTYPARPTPWESKAPAMPGFTSEDLYRDVMYHGPTWRGIAEIRQLSDHGLTAGLSGAERFPLHAGGQPFPTLADPVVLDAAGQLFGVWTVEHLAEGYLVFPRSIKAIELFGAPAAAGEQLECVVAVRNAGTFVIEGDAEVRDRDGNVRFRLLGQVDRRFHLPLVADPIVRPTALPDLARAVDPESVGLAPAPHVLHFVLDVALEDETGLIRRVWASRIRTRAERSRSGLSVSSMPALVREHLSKEAIARFLRTVVDGRITPADVELTDAGVGVYRSSGWRDDPQVWLASCGSTWAAVVCPGAAATDDLLARAESLALACAASPDPIVMSNAALSRRE
ncbi:type I polyketide synthase [Smaragdicoccus niigatensis]|uniref:type I polyketide synthase n=1 Tax=Smaragdicoccus niigatensis TaxID=359359 RepID=UPI00037464F0|nr:type I polyketide synthase [Smaragdicoccus niigatensis]